MEKKRWPHTTTCPSSFAIHRSKSSAVDWFWPASLTQRANNAYDSDVSRWKAVQKVLRSFAKANTWNPKKRVNLMKCMLGILNNSIRQAAWKAGFYRQTGFSPRASWDIVIVWPAKPWLNPSREDLGVLYRTRRSHRVFCRWGACRQCAVCWQWNSLAGETWDHGRFNG